MSRLKILLLLPMLSLFLIHCSSDSSNSGNGQLDGEPNGQAPDKDKETNPNPSSATLVFPENNSECIEGEIISETQSIITFHWSESENTDSYDIRITNLNTLSTTTRNSMENQIDISLERGTPYEWYVISKAQNTNSAANSDSWQFYNSGQGIENYAPFPAKLLFPLDKEVLDNGNTYRRLQWHGNDIDNDITYYKVFVGPSHDEMDLLSTTANQDITLYNLLDIELGKTYYWQIKTHDSFGNSSLSKIFSFIFR